MDDVLFDLEGDGLKPTKIHCFVYEKDGKFISLTSYDDIREVVLNAKRLIGHNITLFDVPVLERILNIKVEAELVDTLAVSWYLYPKRQRHGLEWWGEDFGVPKPKIDDWEGLSLKEYIHRCTEDVKINLRLWRQQMSDLLELYSYNEKGVNRLLNYLQFKMNCARLQEESRWRLDKDKAVKSLEKLTEEKKEMSEALAAVMPRVAVTAKRQRPKKPFKQDGTYSAVGERWFKALRDNNKPEDFQGELEIIVGWKEPNPDSSPQVKDWLFSLGWEPANFKWTTGKDGEERKIPQVRIEGEDGKELCPSVLRLADQFPEIELLERITILTHRISILEAFIEAEEDGYVTARINGFTNTLRFKHKEVVNLPGVDKLYGDIIRGCLIAPEGYELCGSDQSSLEDRTKQHYMWDYDPDYVTEMNVPGFDPHLDIALQGNMLTQEQVNAHKEKREDHGVVRKKAKVTNYSATYGIKPLGLHRRSGMAKRECEALLDTFWKRNWSIKAIAADQEVKTIGSQMWLWNPVAKLWYSLRHEKDIFSTLNQGTGTYCFDRWVAEILKKRPQLTAQFHDEVVLCVKKGNREKAVSLLKEAVQTVNRKLKLNRDLDVEVQFGDSYAEIH